MLRADTHDHNHRAEVLRGHVDAVGVQAEWFGGLGLKDDLETCRKNYQRKEDDLQTCLSHCIKNNEKNDDVEMCIENNERKSKEAFEACAALQTE